MPAVSAKIRLPRLSRRCHQLNVRTEPHSIAHRESLMAMALLAGTDHRKQKAPANESPEGLSGESDLRGCYGNAATWTGRMPMTT